MAPSLNDTGSLAPDEHPGQLETEASALLRNALHAHGVSDGGVLVGPPIPLDPGDLRAFGHEGMHPLHVSHDEREAPVALHDDGSVDDGTLVSITDEQDTILLAWAAGCTPETRVIGLGIDLASLADFAGARGERFNRLLFTAGEQELVHKQWASQPELGYAFAFSAKEAAFKACAAPLRTWYRTHDEELLFDLRGFELDGWAHERGTARHGEAQRAMELLGITSIELHRLAWEDMALTIALALRRP
jgi:phosphopantetheinyl transferase (holo-ACP synthase)